MNNDEKLHALHFSRLREERLTLNVAVPADASDDEVDRVVTKFVTEWYDDYDCDDGWKLKDSVVTLEGREVLDGTRGRCDLPLCAQRKGRP